MSMSVKDRLNLGVGALSIAEFAELEGAPSAFSVYLRIRRGSLTIPTLQDGHGTPIRIPVSAVREHFQMPA
ncbi:hypothetical protein [Specibacter sp. RAF43]|uniref:hypothetical protein n=1 Tax=Specibacter sp. RAF43 TaxID=3233057 RepID=UPI003F9D8857